MFCCRFNMQEIEYNSLLSLYKSLYVIIRDDPGVYELYHHYF